LLSEKHERKKLESARRKYQAGEINVEHLKNRLAVGRLVYKWLGLKLKIMLLTARLEGME